MTAEKQQTSMKIYKYIILYPKKTNKHLKIKKRISIFQLMVIRDRSKISIQ